MSTICKACNLSGHGMINIYSHPNSIDRIFTLLTDIKIIENDCLCIPCYDDMKIAYAFRQKCLQSDLMRQTTKVEQIGIPPSDAPDDDPSDEIIQKNEQSNTQQDKMNLNEHEISTTSVIDCIKLKIETEPIDSPVESTTDYIVKDDKMLEDNVVDYDDDDDTDDLMIDYQELDNEDYGDGFIGEDSNNGYGLSPSALWHCVECDKSYKSQESLQKHIKIHEPLDPTECNKGHTSLETLQNQVNKIHIKSLDKPVKPNIRKKRNQTPKYSEEDIFQSIHETQCEFCFTEFGCAKERQTHEEDHRNEEKPYKCPFNNCTSHFKEKYGLRNHIRIHSDYKRYKCRYCDHRFHQRGNIISHERLHTGEKPFLCPHCGKGFAESGNLKAHIRFHTGERPYTCSICEKSFKTHYAHKIHVRTHTKERPYLCSDCGKSFSSSGKLLVHKRIHTGQRPYKCVECPSAFVNSTGLKRHSKIHISKRNKK